MSLGQINSENNRIPVVCTRLPEFRQPILSPTGSPKGSKQLVLFADEMLTIHTTERDE